MSDEGKIPLGEIVDTIEARVRSLQRYPGNMKAETVGRICNHLTAGADVLRFVEAYADGLRHLVEFLRDQRARGVGVEEVGMPLPVAQRCQDAEIGAGRQAERGDVCRPRRRIKSDQG